MTQFDDWEEWKTNVLEKQYYESSYISYQFNGGMYALPETQNFNVLFYRQDILDELGLEVPETWDDLISILPTITNNNLQVGIPSTERKVGNTANPDLANYFCQLYQRGGSLYTPGPSRRLLLIQKRLLKHLNTLQSCLPIIKFLQVMTL